MEARKALKIPQKDFAKALCVSSSFLSDVEKKRRKANDRLLKLVSMVFGISEKWLKSGKEEMLHKSPDEKINRLVNIFNELPPDFQDFALSHLDRLLARSGNVMISYTECYMPFVHALFFNRKIYIIRI